MPQKKKLISPKLPAPVDSHKRANIPTEELLGVGRWVFLEIVDPQDAKNTVQAFLKGKNVDGIMPIFKES